MAEKSKEEGKREKGEKGKNGPAADGPTANGPTANGPTANGPTANRATANGPTVNGSTDAHEETTPHPFEALLDEYPLREPSEDPVWSVRIVKGWMYFLAFNFAWMFLFFILGIFYE